MSNGQTDVTEQNAEVHSSEDTNRKDEHLAKFASALFIGDKVAEAHHQVQGDQSDDLIECLDVCVESGSHGMCPVQENDDEHRGHQLNGNLAPEEFDPEDADEAKADSPQEVSHGYEKGIPLALLVSCVLQE